MSKGGIFFYVPHHRQAEYEALGWVFERDLGPPHGCYSSLFRWAGDGAPVWPQDHLFSAEENERDMASRDCQLRDFDDVFGVGGDGQ